MKALRDYRGKPIRLMESMRGSDRLVVLYPGMNYTLMGPLFSFLAQALEDSGWDVLGIDYRYHENPAFQKAAATEKDLWFAHDSESVGQWIRENTTAYRRKALVAKSLGTAMLVHQIEKDLMEPSTDLVWLTPGTSAGRICDVLETLPNRCLMAYGSADKYAIPVRVRKVDKRPNVKVLEVPDAKHVFEVPGDIRRTMDNVAEVVEATLAFLAEER